MAIDRVGKGASGVELPRSSEADRTKVAEPERPYGSEKPPATQAATQIQGVGASPLEQLKAGKIDVDHYVDLKVTEATAHLRGLPPAKMNLIKGVLREQIATDPALVDLVRQATGSVASVPED